MKDSQDENGNQEMPDDDQMDEDGNEDSGEDEDAESGSQFENFKYSSSPPLAAANTGDLLGSRAANILESEGVSKKAFDVNY